MLTDVAQQLHSLARRDDIVARVGGEEFAWIMPDTDADAALAAAERARVAVADTDHRDSALTISVGTCDLGDLRSGDALYARADTALLQAKRSGRNRTVSHETPSGSAAPATVSAA